MTILMNILVPLLFVAIGYFIGAIPTGVIIGKAFYHIDPRDYGSGGSGGTNSSRVLGKKAGLIVIALDILKAVIVFYSCWAILNFSSIKNIAPLWDDGVFYLWLSMVAVAIGHCYPIYIGFRGGKAVACFMGSTVSCGWIMLVIDAIAFFSVYKIGKKRNVVSRASIVSGAAICVIVSVIAIINECGVSTNFFCWDLGCSGLLKIGYEAAVANAAIYMLLVYRHHENIKRLKEGTEKEYNLFGK